MTRDGYVLVRPMFEKEEIDLLRSIAKADPVFNENWERKDATGKPIRLKLWNHPPGNIYGEIGRAHV